MSFASLLMPAAVLCFCLLNVVGALSMRRFLADTPRLQTDADLERYRRMVRLQMFLALALAGVGLISVALILSGLGGYLSLVMILAGVFSSKVLMPLQQRCRSVSAEAALRPAYDEISQIWEAKAWPSFPSSQSGGGDEKVVAITCAVHGVDSAAYTCRRCGTFECAACSEGSLGQTLCSACRAHYEALRNQYWRDERNVRVAGMIAIWHAVNPAFVLLLGVPSSLAGQIVVGLVIAWEVATLVVGGLLMALVPRARRLGLLLLAPHLVVFPVGTAATAFAMYALARGGGLHPLSETYSDVVTFTQHRSWGLVAPMVVLAAAMMAQMVLLTELAARFLPS